jgi:ubiquitin-conjugating enzyme E2 O
MLAKLTRVPFFQHFEEFVVGHFHKYGHKVLRGCKAYIDGAQVGCLVGDGVQD